MDDVFFTHILEGPEDPEKNNKKTIDDHEITMSSRICRSWFSIYKCEIDHLVYSVGG